MSQNRRRTSARDIKAKELEQYQQVKKASLAMLALTGVLLVTSAVKNWNLVWNGDKQAKAQTAHSQKASTVKNALKETRPIALKVTKSPSPASVATLQTAYERAEDVSGFPAIMFKKLAQAESGHTPDPKAVSKFTGACGIYQAMPKSTLLEMVYKYADDYPEYRHLKEYVNRIEIKKKDTHGHIKTKFRYVYSRDDAPETLRNACFDPVFSATMMARYHADYLPILAGKIGTNELTFADVRLTHLLGVGTTAKILKALFNGDGDKPVAKFVKPKEIEQNKGVLTNRGNPTTIGHVYAKAIKAMAP